MKGAEMRHRTRLSFAVLGTAILMFASVTGAKANRLSVSSRTFRVVWTELRVTTEFELTIACPMTLEGSFHANTIAKVSGALVGHITRSSVNSAACTGGDATILVEQAPWHFTFERFAGSLPRITGVDFLKHRTEILVIFDFLPGVICLYVESIERMKDWWYIEAGGVVTSVGTEPSSFLDLGRGGVFCPPRIWLIGTGRATVLGSATSIRVTLI